MSKNVWNPHSDGFQFWAFGIPDGFQAAGMTNTPKTLQIYKKTEALSRGKCIFNDF